MWRRDGGIERSDDIFSIYWYLVATVGIIIISILAIISIKSIDLLVTPIAKIAKPPTNNIIFHSSSQYATSIS